jgi:predicted nucleic acid-binding protein
VYVVDTCVLINLLASGHIEDILHLLSQTAIICPLMLAEAIYLRSDDPKNPKELIDLNPLVQNGTLSVHELQGEAEENLYIDYASAVDDGEAMCLALATSRGFHFATDDRKARRVFLRAVNDPTRLAWTSELIRSWAELGGIGPEQLRNVLINVQRRAHFRPTRIDLNYDWWLNASS